MANGDLALKLLVAGIVGAVIGAWAAGKYRSEGPGDDGRDRWAYRSPSSANAGSQAADDGDWRPHRDGDRPPQDDGDWRAARGDGDDWDASPLWDGRRYRPQPRPAAHTTTCWREIDDWEFGTIRRPVPCGHRRRNSS